MMQPLRLLPLRGLPSMRRSVRLHLGALPFDLLADGWVQVTMPPTAMICGVAMRTTVTYPSLAAFVRAALAIHRSGARILGDPS